MNKTIINRNKYLKNIKNFINKDIVKIILWQRRVWKSYIMKQIINLLEKDYKIKKSQIIYINKELYKWDNIKDYSDLYKKIKNYKYIFIDEIQDIKNWEKVIRSLQASGWHDIYIAWSNSNLLSGELSSFLSWRFVSFNIYPLDFKEFLQFHNLEKNKDNFYKYLNYWGLPYLINLELEDEVVNIYLKDVLNTIVLNDVISRYNLRNIHFFKSLIKYLSREIWSIFSAKSISDYLKFQNQKISNNIVLDYLSFSTQALFLNEVHRYDIIWKKIFEIKNKYFFTDIWIRNSLIWWFKQLDIAWILENIVYINLVSNNWEVNVWEINWKEIDFVCKKNNKKIYVQVAYILDTRETIKREFWVYDNVDDHWEKYVITLDEKAWWASKNGIKYMSIIDFVYDLWNL